MYLLLHKWSLPYRRQHDKNASKEEKKEIPEILYLTFHSATYSRRLTIYIVYTKQEIEFDMLGI